MPKKLTPEEEARRFDKQRFGGDAGLTPEEIQKIKDRKGSQVNYQDNTAKDRLNAVTDFDTDPIGFLKEKLAAGNYEGRDRQHNYLLLITLVKIQQALESPDLNLLSRK